MVCGLESRQLAAWFSFLRQDAIPRALADQWDFAFRAKVITFGPYISGDESILDVGCGEGVFSLFAGCLGCRVLAIDHAADRIAENRRMAGNLGLGQVTFETFDIGGGDALAGLAGFDILVCADVLEHLDEPGPVLTSLVRRLAPGGFLFLSLPSPHAPIHRLRRRLVGRDRFDDAVGHKRRYTEAEVMRLVEDAGSEIVEVREVEGILKNWFYVTRTGRFMQRFNRWVLKEGILAADKVLLRAFGGAGFYAVARKSGR